jgi:hypothetical protein
MKAGDFDHHGDEVPFCDVCRALAGLAERGLVFRVGASGLAISAEFSQTAFASIIICNQCPPGQSLVRA